MQVSILDTVIIRKKPCIQLPYVFLVEYFERNYWYVVALKYQVEPFLKYILYNWFFPFLT